MRNSVHDADARGPSFMSQSAPNARNQALVREVQIMPRFYLKYGTGTTMSSIPRARSESGKR